MNHFTVALIGNPNVGKTTLFNKLTHKRHHTGNWAGKTVDIAKGSFKHNDSVFHIIDLPGIYSLNFKSPEEKIAKDFLLSKKFDMVLIVCDATDMRRSLHLALQVIKISENCILCINMEDEAYRKGISIDTKGLEEVLEIPVFSCSARKNIDIVKQNLSNYNNAIKTKEKTFSKEELLNNFVIYRDNDINKTDKKIDKIVCGKYTSVPVMLIFLSLIIWLTVYGANIPSKYIADLLGTLGEKIEYILIFLNTHHLVRNILIDGAYNVLCEVVSVMFVPMALFFPLFSILEESGLLPRIAINSDKPFRKAGSNGKQALTMCMGLGCNAVGVTGCKIMPTKKQRKAAILTNSFIPCNGRFPTLILLISIMLGEYSNSFSVSLLLTFLIVFSVVVTFIATLILNKVTYGETSSCKIELPHYKRPPVLKILCDSFFHKTLKILGRAILVSAPAGILLWILRNVTIGGSTLLILFADFLDPIGKLLSMDGAILLAFILGFPANEIVLPIAASIYISLNSSLSSSELQEILINSGWSFYTALSVSVFTLFHWPCATTLLTIKKETNSLKDTLLSIFLPLLIGTLLCLIINLIRIVLTG